MVAYIRCPYCGHPEVEPNALYCPACDGEIQGEGSASGSLDAPALGSLSSSSASLDLEDLLNLTSVPADTNDVLNLSAKAPTLEHVKGVDERIAAEHVDMNPSAVLLDRSGTVASQPRVLTDARPTVKKTDSWGFHVYLLLLGLCIGCLVFIVDAPNQNNAVTVEITSEAAASGLKALEEERYAAAIKYLEKATQERKNRYLLPSLALAYSKTSQLERSREVMKVYRMGMPDQERKTEEGTP